MTAPNLQMYLTIRVLYPRPENVNDVLSAIKKVSETARRFQGLIEVGAWLDQENRRIISISLWESKEQAAQATQEMHPLFAGIQWAQWERQPAENFLGMERVV